MRRDTLHIYRTIWYLEDNGKIPKYKERKKNEKCIFLGFVKEEMEPSDLLPLHIRVPHFDSIETR